MSDFEWVAFAVIAVLSTARITRLLTWDSYPPSVWLRTKWDEVTHDGPWSLLVHCGYCFGVWAAALVVGWGATDYLLGDGIHPAWWVFNGWLAVAYLAATYMSYDGEED